MIFAKSLGPYPITTVHWVCTKNDKENNNKVVVVIQHVPARRTAEIRIRIPCLCCAENQI
jgi:hypothetical protein